MQVGDGGFGALAVAGAEAEGVFQAALDDLVGHADIDHVRQVVLGRRLGGGQADRRGEGADDGRHAGFIHLLDLGNTGLRLRLRVTEQRFEFGAAHGLDAAGLVDVLDGHQRTQSALLARIGQRTGDGMQHTDLDRLGLRAPDQGKCQSRSGRSRLGHEVATCTHGILLTWITGTWRTTLC